MEKSNHIGMNEVTSKNQLTNGDVQSYLHVNGNNEMSMDSNHDHEERSARSTLNTTSSDVRLLSSNRRTPTTTAVSIV